MKTIFRTSITLGPHAVFLLLSVGSSSVASAHTLLATEPAESLGELNGGSLTLAASSNEPHSGWNEAFSNVPPNTNFFSVNINARVGTDSFEVDSWFDTTGTPVAQYTGGNAINVHTQGSKTAVDTLWALTNTGKLWSVTPVGLNDTWPAWTYIGAVVPGSFDTRWVPTLSVFDSSDTPWVINGDGSCDSDVNSHIYNWNASAKSWTAEPGCLYNMTEIDDTLWGVSFSGLNTILWEATDRTHVSWTAQDEIIPNGTGLWVTSLAVDGSASAGYTVYFSDEQSLYTWSSATHDVTKVVAGSGTKGWVGQVLRDQHSSAVYYTLFTPAGTEELWLY